MSNKKDQKNQFIFLSREHINVDKWNACINNSIKKSIYGDIWFLDAACSNWGGVIMNDYEAVMPISFFKKYGLKFGISPYYVQKTGIYSSFELSQDVINCFYKKIPSRFLIMGAYDFCVPEFGIRKINSRANYELSLTNDYKTNYSNYSSHTKSNVKRSNKNNLTIENTNDVLWFCDFANKNRRFVLPETEKESLFRIVTNALNNNLGEILICKNMQSETIAALFVIKSDNRIYYHSPVANAEGYKNRAVYFMVDYLIKKYSKTQTIIDFEGSNIESIARFFRGFGAANKAYSKIQMFKI
ncbi:MAG: hypothetical protein MI739_08340 [Bacteroidales bacterium]|nr:hypothetical protein [Bacteroidales bacterium]